jgi:hypothetical protein
VFPSLPNALDAGLIVLLLHGALGGFDTFFNHEWDARLARRPSATLELRLHALRSALYAAIFAGLAWLEWRGAFVWLFVALVAAEYLVTLVDSLVEDDTRRLSRVERVNHMVLGFTTGAYFALIGWHALTVWQPQPTALVPTTHGAVSVVLTVYAIGVVLSASRDAFAARRLKNRARTEAPPQGVERRAADLAVSRTEGHAHLPSR